MAHSDYSLPVGYDGWRVGANYTHLLYRLGAPFDITNAYGGGNEFNTYVTYPVLLSSQQCNLSGARQLCRNIKWLSDSVLQDTFHTR